MPINYEHEKQKFFETFNFKVGDKIVIPRRCYYLEEGELCIATITEICPKYLKVITNFNSKKLEYYSQNNKLKEAERPYLYFTPPEELPPPPPELLD